MRRREVGEKIDKIKYLNNQWDTRHQWMGCFLSDRFCPSRATSRCESTNSMFKSRLLTSLTSMELVHLVKMEMKDMYETYVDNSECMKKRYGYISRLKEKSATLSRQLDSFLDVNAAVLSTYVKKKLTHQATESL